MGIVEIPEDMSIEDAEKNLQAWRSSIAEFAVTAPAQITGQVLSTLSPAAAEASEMGQQEAEEERERFRQAASTVGGLAPPFDYQQLREGSAIAQEALAKGAMAVEDLTPGFLAAEATAKIIGAPSQRLEDMPPVTLPRLSTGGIAQSPLIAASPLAPFAALPPPVQRGAANAAIAATEGFIQPKSAAMAPLFMIPGAPAIFGAAQALELPPEIADAIRIVRDPNSTLQQKSEAIARPGVTAALSAMMLHSGLPKEPGYARRIRERAGQIRPPGIEPESGEGESGDQLLVPPPPDREPGPPPPQAAITPPTEPAAPEPTVPRRLRRATFDLETDEVGEDILSWINENMKMLPARLAKKKMGPEKWAQNQPEYESLPAIHERSHWGKAIYSETGSAPDVIASEAYKAGKLPDGLPNTLAREMEKAWNVRKEVLARKEREAAELEATAAFTDKINKKTGRKVSRNTSDLVIGDRFTVGGEEFYVRGIDPDREEVILQGGEKFGTQHVKDGTRIWVEKFRPAAAEAGSPEFVPPAPGVVTEHEALAKQAAEAAGAKVELRATLPGEREGAPERPFARGEIATPLPNGTIAINRQAFARWISRVPEQRRPQAIERLVNEEHIHSQTNPDDALAYWNSLTRIEKAMVRRVYTGKWGGIEGRFTDQQYGWEAVRMRLQQLSRLGIREVVEAAGRERWTVRTIAALQHVIANIRDRLGGEASQQQRAILDRIQQNLGAARSALTGGKGAEAFEKGAEPKPADYSDNDIRLTVFRFGTPALKDFIQADSVKGGKNEWSSNTDDLRRLGFDLPPQEALDRLPSGQYTLAQAKKAAVAPSAYAKGSQEAEGSDLPAYRPVTPEAVEAAATKHFAEHARPNFREFAAQFPDAPPGQLRELWIDNVWKNLLTAPGQMLTRWKDHLGLGKELRGTIPDEVAPQRAEDTIAAIQDRMNAMADKHENQAQTIEDEANRMLRIPLKDADRPARDEQIRIMRMQVDSLRARAHDLRRPVKELISPDQFIKPEPKRLEGAVKEEQDRRVEAISQIGVRLIDSAQQGRPAWRRATVTPDDVGHWRESTEGSIWRVTQEDLADPELLAKRLTEAGGVERSTTRRRMAGGRMIETKSRAVPESVTKRLVALLDPATGKVHLDSIYRSGRAIRAVDPVLAGRDRPNVPFPELLSRYRPIYSVLLDEPVQNFHQEFPSVRAFTEDFAERAERDARQQASYHPPMGEVAPEEPTGYHVGRPMTDAEASGILDHLYDEVGEIESPEDVKLAIQGLGQYPQRLVISGYWKMFQAIRKADPELTPDQAVERMVQQVYENAVKRTDKEDFVRRTMEQSQGEAPGPVQAGGSAAAPAKAPGGGPPSSARELTMRERVPPTVTRPEHLPPGYQPPAKRPAPPVPEGSLEKPKSPEAYFKDTRDQARADVTKIRGQLIALMSRARTENEVTALADGAHTIAGEESHQLGNYIRIQTERLEKLGGKITVDDVKMREAAMAYHATRGDLRSVPILRQKLDNGQAKAMALRRSLDPRDWRIAHYWLRGIARLRRGLDYAEAHWNNPSLRDTARAMREVAREIYDFDTAHGIKLKNEPNYFPGRYEELWTDDAITFSEMGVLGKNFRKHKSFPTVYDAIEDNAYVPKNYDPANVLEHRARQSRMEIYRNLWWDRLRGIMDPHTGKPIVTDPVMVKGQPTDPSFEHVIKQISPFAKPVLVRKGYIELVDAITAQSHLRKNWAGRAALKANAIIKHGGLLLLDTFHPMRLLWYDVGLTGKPTPKGGALAALNYRPQDLPKAVQEGWISQEAADWATGYIPVRLPNGRTINWTRQDVLLNGIREGGLNARRTADALYHELVGFIPGAHRFNKWVFDQFAPALISDAFVREFERLNKLSPETDVQTMMQKVARDLNFYYGNLGRQGLLVNPTMQDIGHILLLAPQWVEGLAQKEVRFWLSRLPRATGKALMGDLKGANLALGSIGRGMGRGLLGMFVLTQALNIITRHKFTWQNEEEGHKLDAFFPTGAGTGFWLSPLSVFSELLHDVLRLNESRPMIWSVFRQIGENKLSPGFRMATILASGRSSTDEVYTSTPRLLAGAAGALAPIPITLSKPAQYLGHRLAPGMIPPVVHGSLQRQLVASGMGMKVEPSKTDLQQMTHKAQRFVTLNKLRTPGREQVSTDEPGYAKLRAALWAEDYGGLARIYKELREDWGIKDSQIRKAMDNWKRRPLTGSAAHERAFKDSLTPAELDQYTRAMEEKAIQLNKFRDWFAIRPETKAD